ncbi:unnamed protein product [Rhizophagus irregularis]|nr:unnamed protein product [Rhizophagus irregularis]
MLIDDMGGNGRALGALELAVKDFKSFENINFLSIAETVFYQLKCHYDELSNKGTLTCPYIWLWLMANASDDDGILHKTKRYFDAKQSFGEETIINKSLSLEQAIYNRESTKSNAYSTNKSVTCKKGGNPIKLRLEDASACIINGPSGDSYIPIFCTNSPKLYIESNF